MGAGLPSDRDLVERIRSGNRADLEILVGRYLPVLADFFRYLSIPHHQIDDFVQETFEKALLNLARYDSGKSFSNWLFSIGRNLAIDHWRRKNKLEEIIRTPPAEPFSEPDREAIGRQSVESLLSSLPSESRLLLELRIFRELSFAEIADLIGETEVNTRSRFFRLMSRLRVTHGKEFDDADES